MDIVIKNIESLSKYTGGQKEMPKKVVVDFDKLSTNEFTTIFFNACEDIKMKEAIERMQSEFDATGKDVAYFMNHRTKPGGLNNE